MALKKNVGLIQGIKYRGGGPMLAWAFHRIGGLAMVLFVGLHVISSFFMQQLGSQWATTINIVYESVWFQLFFVFFIYFHIINGMRIIILDMWPKLLQYQREVTYLQWVVFIPLYAITAYVMIIFKLSGA
jgi:succinate dehydrogenase / fumarate reductase, cytochrome b subunit